MYTVKCFNRAEAVHAMGGDDVAIGINTCVTFNVGEYA